MKARKKLISKFLMLIMCISVVLTGIVFSGITNLVYASAAAVSAESDFTFDASTGTITKYVGYDTNIVIPSTINGISVKSIGDKAFYMCWNLTSVTIPSSVTNIGGWAFAYCSKLTNVTIPDSVKSIGDSAFSNCQAFTSIKIPSGVKSIGYATFFYCKNLTSITIPSSVTSIGNRAFYECHGLTSVTIPNSVTSIGYGAFQGCDQLTRITIPNSVTSIGYNAFYMCDKLASVTIPNSVTSIGGWAFASCDSLTSITIPNSVTDIGYATFAFCSKLTSITISSGVKSIGDGAFDDCDSLTSINIPSSITNIYYSAFENCTNLKNINVESGNINYASDNGVLFNKSKNIVIYYPQGKVETAYTIPNSVTSIGEDAFFGCSLTSITIPSSVTSIGKDAFFSCENLKFYVGSENVKKLLINSGVDSSKITLATSTNSLAVPANTASISSGYDSIKTSWSAVTGASGYEVYRAASSAGTYTLVSTTDSTSFTNTGLITETPYYYKVRAYRTVGTTKYYSYYSAVLSAKPVLAVPARPTVTSEGYNSIKTSWSAVTGASGYEVYRAASNAGTYTLVSTTASTSFTNTGLITETPYYYKVRAYRTVGTTKYYSNYSAVLSAKPVLPVPASPTVVSSGYNSIKTSWNAVIGASGYEVYRASSSAGTYTLVSTTTSTSFANTGLTIGTPYYYKVRAYRTVGTTKYYSNYSAVLSVKPALAVPASLTAISSGYNSIKTSWNAVTGASGYELYRATSSAGTYTLVQATTATSFTNTGLTIGTTYYYKVRAYRTVGATKYYSNYSAVLSAKSVPAIPNNFTATRLSSTSIKLAWNPVSGSLGYEIYKSSSSNGTYSLLKTTTDSNYINTGLTAGSTYYYKVRAYRTIGTTKIYSGWTTVKYAKC